IGDDPYVGSCRLGCVSSAGAATTGGAACGVKPSSVSLLWSTGGPCGAPRVVLRPSLVLLGGSVSSIMPAAGLQDRACASDYCYNVVAGWPTDTMLYCKSPHALQPRF